MGKTLLKLYPHLIQKEKHLASMQFVGAIDYRFRSFNCELINQLEFNIDVLKSIHSIYSFSGIWGIPLTAPKLYCG